MKRIISIFLLILLTAASCSSKPAKLTSAEIEKFPYDVQLLFENNDPDVVSMDYLIKHSDKYARELVTDTDDFFVIVKGKLNRTEVVDYSKEDLSIMSNQEAADLLKDTISYNYYIDDAEKPVTNNDEDLGLIDGSDYYFMVFVKDIAGSYSYLALDAFE